MYNTYTCNSFQVCRTLNNPTVVLSEISVCLFEAFCPMLSQRCKITDVDKAIKSQNDMLFVDVKLDGERFQLHWDKDKNKFKYYSRCVFFPSHISHWLTLSNNSFFFSYRRGNDYTDTYGFNDVNGVLSPSIVKQFKPNVRNCILDGEMMCYNPKYKSFTTKGNKF